MKYEKIVQSKEKDLIKVIQDTYNLKGVELNEIRDAYIIRKWKLFMAAHLNETTQDHIKLTAGYVSCLIKGVDESTIEKIVTNYSNGGKKSRDIDDIIEAMTGSIEYLSRKKVTLY